MPQRKPFVDSLQRATPPPTQKLTPRDGASQLFAGDTEANPILRLLEALGVGAESVQNLFDPQYTPQDVHLPNDTGEIDVRTLQGKEIPPNDLARPLARPTIPGQPRRLPALSPSLSKGTP